MGTYTFKWPNAGEDVFVTGTFDDWSKSVKLDKAGDVFEKTVELPDTSDKIYYKFVVDGEWTVNQAAPKENDPSGIENNFLTPEDIVKSVPIEAAVISSVGPGATTVTLLKDVPLEKKEEPAEAAAEKESTEPTAEMNGKEDRSLVPGAFPETPAADLDKEIKMINPLPASDGAVNPIKLAPGEKIPESITAQDTNAHVKLDPESYEKADTLPGVSDILSSLPPVSGNMIPESSLPIADTNDITINSVGAGATTLALAADAPLEPKAPAIVKESQEKAGVEPEASAVSEEIKEKAAVESELLEKVPEVPPTSEGTAGKGTEKSETDKTMVETATAAATSMGAAVAASAVAAKDTVVEQTPDSVKQQLPESVQDAIAPAGTQTVAAAAAEEIRQEVAPEVPAEVKESLVEAGKSPEAAANAEAVEEKKAVEAELLKEVSPVPAVGEESKKAEEKTEEPAETKVEEPVATKVEEPVAAKVEEPVETKKTVEPTETKKAEVATPEPVTNGAEPSTPAKAAAPETPAKTETPSSAAATKVESPATTEKKKKNRLSQIFSKIKHKVSSSNK